MDTETLPPPAADVKPPETAAPTPVVTAEKPQGFGPVAGISRDRDKKVFDPSKHLPIKDDNGRWKRLNGPGRPGRPPGSKNKLKAAGMAEEPPPADFSDVKRIVSSAGAGANAEAEESGAVVSVETREQPTNPTCETIIATIQMILVLIGEEEGVLSDTEKMLIRPALMRVLKKYEVSDDALPCEIELILAIAGIIIERIKKGGKTATWFAKAKAWALGMFFKGKGAMLGRDLRREVPQNIVEQLGEKVRLLESQLAAAKAA